MVENLENIPDNLTEVLKSPGKSPTEALPPLKPTTLSKEIDQAILAGERREKLRLEAAVNLAVATALNLHGIREVRIFPQDLETFQQNYKASQELHDDGSFTIRATAK
jgi:hypothetical protein